MRPASTVAIAFARLAGGAIIEAATPGSTMVTESPAATRKASAVVKSVTRAPARVKTPTRQRPSTSRSRLSHRAVSAAAGAPASA